MDAMVHNLEINYYPISIAPKLLFAIWAPPRKRKVFFFGLCWKKRIRVALHQISKVALSCGHSVRVEVAGHAFISDATGTIGE